MSNDEERQGIAGYDMTTLLDSQPVIVSAIDPRSYTVKYQNGTGKKMLGVIRGKTCYENIPKLGTACPFCKMPQAMETGELQSSEVNLPDGKWLLVQFAPVKRPDGKQDIIETITDITEMKVRELELDRTVNLLVDREEKIETLRDQIRSLGGSPKS
ncbi:MAG: PAS domain-containing protein [Kofleriaceae bacterium]